MNYKKLLTSIVGILALWYTGWTIEIQEDLVATIVGIVGAVLLAWDTWYVALFKAKE